MKVMNCFSFPDRFIDKELQNRPECLVIRFEQLENLLAAGYSDGKIIIYGREKNSYRLLHQPGIEKSEVRGAVCSVRWKPHSNKTPKNVLLSVSTDGEIIHWHTESGKILHKVVEYLDNESKSKPVPLLSLDYSPDGSKFAVGGEDKILRIYDENMKIISHKFPSGGSYVPGHTNRINSVCFHKKDSTGNFENLLVSGGWDQKVILYDVRSNKIVYTIKGPYIGADSIDMKDYLLLTGSSMIVKNKLKLWDLRTYKEIDLELQDDLSNSFDSNIYSLQFSPNKDTNIFAYGGSNMNQVRMYGLEIYDEEEVDKSKSHQGDIGHLLMCTKYLEKPCYTLDFSSSGNYFAFSGGDGSIRIIKLSFDNINI